MNFITEAAGWLFGGDTPNDPLFLYQIGARALFVYMLGLAVVRVGKSRMISRVSALDVILGFILGSLLSRGITGHASISGTAVACAAIVAAHWVFTAIGYYWHPFGQLIKGHAFPVIENGVILESGLRRSHISRNDLMGELRDKGVDDVAEVKLAMKERSGDISVVKQKQVSIVEVKVQDGVQVVRIEVAGA